MPVYQDDKDYAVVREIKDDRGISRVIFNIAEGCKDVEVHVFGKREDKEEFERVGGTRLNHDPDSDEAEGSVTVGVATPGGKILARDEVEVHALDPDAIEDTSYEVHDL